MSAPRRASARLRLRVTHFHFLCKDVTMSIRTLRITRLRRVFRALIAFAVPSLLALAGTAQAASDMEISGLRGWLLVTFQIFMA